MNAQQIIRAAIPEADDALCEHILWGRTPFPCSAISARSLYLAAHRYKRASANKIHLCDFCDNIAAPNDTVCSECGSALGRVREEIRNETRRRE
mgnify:CR=1 FL=1